MEANGQTPGGGPIVVTGATGGVGCIAVNLLTRAGYEVHAISGKTADFDWLESLGAKQCISRHDLHWGQNALEKAIWAGAIDNVGGDMLAGLTRVIQLWGNIACCGMAGSHGLHTTVFPMILRGVAMGLIFVPLTAATVADLPSKQMAQGTGLFNLSRQLGGSFGIAITATLLARFTEHARDVGAVDLVDHQHKLLGRFLEFKGPMADHRCERSLLRQLRRRGELDTTVRQLPELPVHDPHRGSDRVVRAQLRSRRFRSELFTVLPYRLGRFTRGGQRRIRLHERAVA